MSVDFALHFDPVGDVLAAARECEATVFLERYGNTAEQWAEEYGPYDPASTFLAVTDVGGDAVATMRLITPSAAGLKSLVDSARPPWAVDGARAARATGMVAAQTWDVATIAIRRGAARGGVLSAALYHGLLLATRANTVRWIVMIMDVRARRLLDAAGLPTQLLPGARVAPYLGSAASVPLWAEVASMVDHQRRTNPDAYRLISLGVGLDSVAMPGVSEFVLTRKVPMLAVAGAPIPQAVPVSASLNAGLATA